MGAVRAAAWLHHVGPRDQIQGCSLGGEGVYCGSPRYLGLGGGDKKGQVITAFSVSLASRFYCFEEPLEVFKNPHHICTQYRGCSRKGHECPETPTFPSPTSHNLMETAVLRAHGPFSCIYCTAYMLQLESHNFIQLPPHSWAVSVHGSICNVRPHLCKSLYRSHLLQHVSFDS